MKRAHDKAVLAECDTCHATGLYIGMLERNGAAVPCNKCGGTGARRINYTPFTGRLPREGVRRVYCSGSDRILDPDRSPGGIPIEEWHGGPVPIGPEIRNYQCPHNWRGFSEIPACSDSPLGGYLCDCPHFGEKHLCWAAYDGQQIRFRGKKEDKP